VWALDEEDDLRSIRIISARRHDDDDDDDVMMNFIML
jgi:hypothetical protein